MLRILLIALVIIVVMAVFTRLRSAGKTVRDASEKILPATLVQCAYCHLHLIREDAVKSGGHYYCGAEHQKMAKIESKNSA